MGSLIKYSLSLFFSQPVFDGLFFLSLSLSLFALLGAWGEGRPPTPPLSLSLVRVYVCLFFPCSWKPCFQRTGLSQGDLTMMTAVMAPVQARDTEEVVRVLEVHVPAGLATSSGGATLSSLHVTPRSSRVHHSLAAAAKLPVLHALNALITVLTLLASHNRSLSFSTALLRQHSTGLPKKLEQTGRGLLPPGGQIPQGCQQRSEAALTEQHLHKSTGGLLLPLHGAGAPPAAKARRARSHSSAHKRRPGSSPTDP